jgi:hypothetical protein
MLPSVINSLREPFKFLRAILMFSLVCAVRIGGH